MHGLNERRLVLLGVVGDVDLLELGLLLGQLDALLLQGDVRNRSGFELALSR